MTNETGRFWRSETYVVIHNFQKSRGLSQQVKHLALSAMPEETAILCADCPALYDSFFLVFRLLFPFFFVFSFSHSSCLFTFPSFCSSSLHNAKICTTM